MSKWLLGRRRSDEYALHHITRFRRGRMRIAITIFLACMGCAAVGITVGYLIGRGKTW